VTLREWRHLWSLVRPVLMPAAALLLCVVACVVIVGAALHGNPDLALAGAAMALVAFVALVWETRSP